MKYKFNKILKYNIYYNYFCSFNKYIKYSKIFYCQLIVFNINILDHLKKSYKNLKRRRNNE